MDIIKIENILAEISEKYTHPCVFIDAAGIGDSCYTRLLIQNIISSNPQILHIVPPIVVSLYKDDNLVTVVPGYSIPYRFVTDSVCVSAYKKVDGLVRKYFRNRKVYHLGSLICDAASRNKLTKMRSIWSLATGIPLDNEPGNLKHNGIIKIPLTKKHVVLEYRGVSMPNHDIEIFNRIITKYSSNYDVCWVGSVTDPPLVGGVDCRGMDLYDTLSLLKSSELLIHIGSGIYTMCNTFLPQIKAVSITDSLFV
jgi:hypothetical protein